MYWLGDCYNARPGSGVKLCLRQSQWRPLQRPRTAEKFRFELRVFEGKCKSTVDSQCHFKAGYR